MKRTSTRLLLPALVALGLVGSASQLHAQGPGPHHGPAHYQHDRNGYWDAHRHHHPYIVRNGHHGYWYNHIWIIVD